jgi:hypothetical protein
MANQKLGSHPSHGYSYVEKLDSARQLASNDSGKLFMIDNTSAFTINLPKLNSGAIAGWHCKMIVQVDGSAVVSVVAHGLTAAGGTTGDAETVVYREVPMADEAGAVTTSQDGFTIAAASIIGDSFEIMTDGTSWFVTAIVHEVAHADDIDA